MPRLDPERRVSMLAMHASASVSIAALAAASLAPRPATNSSSGSRHPSGADCHCSRDSETRHVTPYSDTGLLSLCLEAL